ncbi:hypothetical protein K0M31_005438 [Melipona bicolor]|uniref:Uncharacterized protein n=1 Tax=Melipona bicolor TaxID=60889 RepID=A0AA40FVM9_9HYME|nr:hypothetical protein K0M31_005438 [Melipona bicolor]
MATMSPAENCDYPGKPRASRFKCVIYVWDWNISGFTQRLLRYPVKYPWQLALLFRKKIAPNIFRKRKKGKKLAKTNIQTASNSGKQLFRLLFYPKTIFSFFFVLSNTLSEKEKKRGKNFHQISLLKARAEDQQKLQFAKRSSSTPITSGEATFSFSSCLPNRRKNVADGRVEATSQGGCWAETRKKRATPRSRCAVPMTLRVVNGEGKGQRSRLVSTKGSRG